MSHQPQRYRQQIIRLTKTVAEIREAMLNAHHAVVSDARYTEDPDRMDHYVKVADLRAAVKPVGLCEQIATRFAWARQHAEIVWTKMVWRLRP